MAQGEDIKKKCETLIKNIPRHTTMIIKIDTMLNVNKSQQHVNKTIYEKNKISDNKHLRCAVK